MVLRKCGAFIIMLSCSFPYGSFAENQLDSASAVVDSTQHLKSPAPADSEVIIGNTSQKPVRQPQTESAYPVRAKNDNQLLRDELLRARHVSAAGGVMYGVGLGAELIGAIVFVNDVVAYENEVNNSNNDYYYSNSSAPSSPSFTGLYIALVGGGTSLAGTIVANVGGTKARNISIAMNNTAPSFHGWGLFVGGIACNVAGSFMSMIGVPVVPTILSIGGVALNLSSVIHSISYSHKVYLSSIALSDIKVAPIVDKKLKINGLRLTASF